MSESLGAYLTVSADVVRASVAHISQEKMDNAVRLCVASICAGKPVLVCGNGGSACDAMHIACELVGRFLKERRGLNCLCLSANPGTLTSCSNDYGYDTVFSRQVEAYGSAGATLIGLSTSGNSPNVLLAFEKAKEMGMSVLGMTGEGGGKMAALCDVLLDVPSTKTPLIQQVHICLYHYLCEQIEAQFA